MSSVAIIDGELNLAIAEALENLAEPAQSHGALSAHLLQVDLDRNDFAIAGRLMKHGAGRIDDAGTAGAALRQTR